MENNNSNNDSMPYAIKVLTTLVKGIDTKIDKVTSKVEKLTEDNIVHNADIERIKEDIASIQDKQEELSKKIEAVEDANLKKSSERWNNLVNNTIKLMLSISFTALLAYIGINI